MIQRIETQADRVADDNGCGELAKLRHVYCASAKPWICPGFRSGSDTVVPLRWRPKGPNSVLAYGSDPAAIGGLIAELVESRVRAEILMDGPALGDVQVLVDAGWVCVGARPFMRRLAHPDEPHTGGWSPHAERLAGDVVELSSPRDVAWADELVAQAFGFGVADSRSARNHERCASDMRVWALHDDGDMVACGTTVQIDDTVVVWDVATLPQCQRRGYGTSLVRAVHRRYAERSAVRQFLLLSSEPGYHLYESLGYETIAWWQAWSRPRWTLGRA